MGIGDNTNDQTYLQSEELEGLLIKTISTREELNEAEQLNIHEAVEWTLVKKFSSSEILSERFVRHLHKKMYGRVWKWAGKFRNTNKNIGVDKYEIAVELRKLLDDTALWVEHNIFPPDEIAVRFKHRLVAIHCFPNGNGRHSRLMADVIVSHVFAREVFTWGASDLYEASVTRDKYLEALRKADKQNITHLLKFSRFKRTG